MIRDPRQRLIVALFLSLLGNLFLAGWLFSSRPWDPPLAGNPMVMGRPILAVEGQPAVADQVWQRHGHAIRAAMRNMGQARQQVRESLGRPDWDQTAVTASLAELRQRTQESQLAWHQALVETAAQLPPAQRARLLEAGMGHGPGMGMGRRLNRSGPPG